MSVPTDGIMISLFPSPDVIERGEDGSPHMPRALVVLLGTQHPRIVTCRSITHSTSIPLYGLVARSSALGPSLLRQRPMIPFHGPSAPDIRRPPSHAPPNSPAEPLLPPYVRIRCRCPTVPLGPGLRLDYCLFHLMSVLSMFLV